MEGKSQNARLPVGAGMTGVTTARLRARKRPRRATARVRAKRSFQRHWQLYLIMLPPLAVLAVFKYVPMANTVIAFKDYNVVKGIWASPWAGLQNFEAFFGNPVFTTLLKNTLILSLYTLLVTFPVPIIFALALNEVRVRWFKKTVQLVTFAPYFISAVVVVSMTVLLLAPQLGILSRGLGLLGVDATNILGSPTNFRHIFVATEVWQTVGFWTIIYLAALSTIDISLYEAASIDGSSRLQKIRHIDFPGIKPTAAIILILAAGSTMTLYWEKVFLLQNPLNSQTSEIINTYVYKIGLLNADFSLASAVGLFNAVINLLLIVAVNAIAKRLSGSGLWS